MKNLNYVVTLLVVVSLQLAQAWNFNPWSKGAPAATVDNRSELDKALEEIRNGCELMSKGDCLNEMIAELDRRHDDEKLIDQLMQTLHLEDIMPPRTTRRKGAPFRPASFRPGGTGGLGRDHGSGLQGVLNEDHPIEPNVVHRTITLSIVGYEKLKEFARSYEENDHVAIRQMFAKAHTQAKEQLNDKGSPSQLLVRGNSTIFELPICFADYLLSIREDFLKIKENRLNFIETLLTMGNLKNIYEQVVKISSSLKNGRCVGSSTGSLERFLRGKGTAALRNFVNRVMSEYFPNSVIDPNRVTELLYRLFYYLLSLLMGTTKMIG